MKCIIINNDLNKALTQFDRDLEPILPKNLTPEAFYY